MARQSNPASNDATSAPSDAREALAGYPVNAALTTAAIASPSSAAAVAPADQSTVADTPCGKVRRTDDPVQSSLPLEKDECRLCLEEVLEDVDPTDGGLLLRPCNCKSAVHKDCLARWRAAQLTRADRSYAENNARASTCEVCGSLWSVDGIREALPTRIAICRAHGGFRKVALRRVPTDSREHAVFSDWAASEGQELEVLELDRTGQFFRVRATNSQRYHGVDAAAVAEGWLRRCYLEWPGVFPDASNAATSTQWHLRPRTEEDERRESSGGSEDGESEPSEDAALENADAS